MSQKNQYAGLTESQVAESRERYGSNILTPPKRKPMWKLFLEKFNDPIIRVLLIAALLSLMVSIVHNEYSETIGILCAILLSTGVAFWFEADANRKFDVLNKVNDDTAVKAIRNGNITEVPKREVVVGDIVLLETGEEVPADGRLLEEVSLQVNESTLTGEPVIDKTTDPAQFDREATYPSDCIYRGTTVVDGHCTYRVEQVGDATEFGKVAQKAAETGNKEETPLNRQLEGLARFVGAIGFILSLLVFIALFAKGVVSGQIEASSAQLALVGAAFAALFVTVGKFWFPMLYGLFEIFGSKKRMPRIVAKSWLVWIGMGLAVFVVLCAVCYFAGIDPLDKANWMSASMAGHLLQYFMVAVTLIVVSMPEGLPMSVTLSLALSMKRMLKTNNLVRKMHACETMGAVTVICTDKTGTLTQNRMQVHQTDFYSLPAQTLSDNQASHLIAEGIAVNSTAFLDFSGQTVKTLGNPTESALLLWLHSKGLNYVGLREGAKIIDQITFSTERKYMATLVDSPLMDQNILYIKGAPEIVLGKCTEVLDEKGAADVAPYKTPVEEKLLAYQNQAMRTLGFAYKLVAPGVTEIADLASGGFTFLGIAAISDPVRQDVPEAVAECLDAGIAIKIVTGDTPGTAREIARQIGIWTEGDGPANIITGPEFEALSDAEALQRIPGMKIMCRARPMDKQRLVNLLQKLGEVVAVTGDGTNDAPALNHAQVGLSMGTGTSVAKEASDITLLDDSFKSIATAVMWGRSLYLNIQRFVLFQLTINLAAIIIVLIGSLFGQEIPLTVTQMLWVNLIMDTFAAAALASLPPHKDVMKNKPRNAAAFIVTRAMKSNILITGSLFVAALLALLYLFTGEDGSVSAYNLSAFFTVFVMLQLWNLFNAKAFGTNKSAFRGMGHCFGFVMVLLLILVGQILIVQFGGEVFRTVPLSFKDWLIIIGATSAVLWIGELVRLVRK